MVRNFFLEFGGPFFAGKGTNLVELQFPQFGPGFFGFSPNTIDDTSALRLQRGIAVQLAIENYDGFRKYRRD